MLHNYVIIIIRWTELCPPSNVTCMFSLTFMQYFTELDFLVRHLHTSKIARYCFISLKSTFTLYYSLLCWSCSEIYSSWFKILNCMLQIGGNKMFKMLYDSNFTYDSSMPVYENKPPSWPYTLDYKIFHDCMIPPCPTRSYPGEWNHVVAIMCSVPDIRKAYKPSLKVKQTYKLS